jgi:hypothetical protein
MARPTEAAMGPEPEKDFRTENEDGDAGEKHG